MTDLTPTASDIPAGPLTLSAAQIMELEKQLRENKQAQLRGDPLPHNITPAMLRDAVNAIKRQRGVMDFAEKVTGGKTSKAKAGVDISMLDLDGLDDPTKS